MFSAVIPVYNVAPYIIECLDSIFAAAKKCDAAIEVICVDDGSTDGSGALLDEYASTFNLQPSTFNLHIIHQPNGGVSKARNAGIEAAGGEYLCFIDGDDAVREDYFVQLKSAIDATNADIVRFNHQPLTHKEKSSAIPLPLPLSLPLPLPTTTISGGASLNVANTNTRPSSSLQRPSTTCVIHRSKRSKRSSR